MTQSKPPKPRRMATAGLLLVLPFAAISASPALADSGPSGVKVVAVAAESAAVSWNPYPGAAMYRVRLDWDGGSVGPKVDGTLMEWTRTSDDPQMIDSQRLQPDTTYQVRVRALTSTGADLSSYSTAVTFTTASADSLPELAPAEVSVAAASKSSLYVAWRTRGPGFDYELAYGTDSDLSNAKHVRFSVSGGVLSGLSPSTKYYLKVRVVDGSGNPASPYSSVVSASTPGPSFAPGIKVASYNVLKPGSGINSWNLRRTLIAANITAADPDIIGLQEDTGVSVTPPGSGKLKQWADLDRLLSAKYAYTTTDNTSGTRVLYDTSRLTKIASGYQRLAPLVDKNPRYGVWAIFSDKLTGQRMFFINTHLQPTKGSSSSAVKKAWTTRNKQASAVLKLISAKNPSNLPVVVTGDMNSSRGTKPSNGAYAVYTAGGLIDPLGNADDTWFATTQMGAEQAIDVNYNTFNGQGRTARTTKYSVGTHVDYILTRNVARVAQVQTVVNLDRQGRYIGTFPSDHNLLTAWVHLH